MNGADYSKTSTALSSYPPDYSSSGRLYRIKQHHSPLMKFQMIALWPGYKVTTKLALKWNPPIF